VLKKTVFWTKSLNLTVENTLQGEVGVLEELGSGTFYSYRYSLSKHLTKVTLCEIAPSP
jgi:hypothetical protein